jgi:hypothetical protein
MGGTMAAVGRGAAWLLPAGRRDWVAAVWAEAHEVPPGLPRLAWCAGGIWMLARETLRPRQLVRAALFAVAAAGAAWAAWPEPAVGHAAVSQFHVIATVLLLAGLPLLARRFFGPASSSWAGRFLRVFWYAAVLAFMPAFAIVEAFAHMTPRQEAYRHVWGAPQGVPGTSTGGPGWAGEIELLLLIACYGLAILWLTSRRARVTRSTLAIGTSTGLLFGLVMYLVAPLGLTIDSTDPLLSGSQVDALVAVAWILLFGGPAAAALLASRRCRGPAGAKPPSSIRISQGIAAGVLANLTGALFVTTLGTGTTALMLESPWLLHWLEHGQQLTAITAYRYEIHATAGLGAYVLMAIGFPLIGLFTGSPAAAFTNAVPRESGPRTDGGGPPGPGPEPAPGPPPPGGRLADPQERVPVLS